MHVANVIDVYASRDTPFALIFRTYPQLLPPCRQPLYLLLLLLHLLHLFCRVVHRWILPFFILSKGTDGVSVENGNREGEGPVAHRICCYVLRVSAVYTRCTRIKGSLCCGRSNGPDERREREESFSFPPLSIRSILDTRPRLSSPVPVLPLQLIRFFIRGHWHRHRVSVSSSSFLLCFLLLFDGIDF